MLSSSSRVSSRVVAFRGWILRKAVEPALVVGVVLLVSCAEVAAAGENPDFTKGEAIPEAASHDWNLGPTGLRGWIYAHRMETTEARQVYVTEVEAGSPADGVFEVGDVVLGVGGKAFEYDPRTELGKAIGEAEEERGRLVLIRWRDGDAKRVTLQIPVLGSYSSTAPFDCKKSDRVFAQGCEALARKLREKPNAGNWIVRSYDALALLSSGNERYLPLVRQQVEAASTYSDPERKSYHSWFYGPVNLLLAEYTLATGDETYRPSLRRITMEIVNGQSEVGSWGHRFVQKNGRLAGYGMMNATGLPLIASLILAREAGVEDPALDAAIEKSTRLIRFYVGKGSVPYGDHHPWIEAHDDNGKNGIAAIVFHLLGDAEAAEYYSRMSVASHGAERDTGHTGNYFNMLWAMPGVALSGPHATGAWMEEFGGWYYDLARRWDGSFIHQGAPQPRPDSYRRWDCTGAYLLAYGQAYRKLRITGRGKRIVPQVDRKTANGLIADGRGWSPRRKLAEFAKRTDEEIVAGLTSWSPVLRERSGIEFARRGIDATTLLPLLKEGDLQARLGACQALIAMKERAAPAVADLMRALKSDDLWLRIKAAEALASTRDAASAAIPELLSMLATPPSSADPRGMQQRYLTFALFDRRDGMLSRSLDGVDREALYAAVRAGLQNQDGRARGNLGTVYRRLDYDEIEPLLSVIHRAVVEPAPSGIMFADGIRLSGLEILARHKIREGLPLCLSLIDLDRWGSKDRVRPCLAAIRHYGGAARPLLPDLLELEKELLANRWKPEEVERLEIPKLIAAIENAEDAPDLRPLPQ